MSDLGLLLKEIVGMSIESIGVDTAWRVVERRMCNVGVDELSDYIALVQRSELERQILIDSITVPETWFFRDHEPFLYLVKFVRSLRASVSPNTLVKPVRILSVPCATGEEPYSIAMMLLDAGFDKESIEIEAVDISQSAIVKAKKGLFGANSFRGKEVVFQKRYFTEQVGGLSISNVIKGMVNFSQQNILTPGFMKQHEPFDLVLCRNLLIYFDLPTKTKVLTVLHKRMAEKSLLILGHAETGRMAEGLFESVRQSGSFSYRKIVSGERSCKLTSPPNRIKRALLGERRESVSDYRQKKSEVAMPELRSLETKKTPKQKILKKIREMADQGRLKEALKECDDFISATPNDAQGYYLKGVILLALNDDSQAITAFKKTLYLDIKHYSSLMQLSVLMEELGDVSQAENYRMRAERLRTQGLDQHD